VGEWWKGYGSEVRKGAAVGLFIVAIRGRTASEKCLAAWRR